jgi:hypothetical protein
VAWSISTEAEVYVYFVFSWLFGEERRRTKIIPPPGSKLMYAALIHAAERWTRLDLARKGLIIKKASPGVRDVQTFVGLQRLSHLQHQCLMREPAELTLTPSLILIA